MNRVYCTETRPYNQGARLTAYELVHEKMPATLITDSMAASLMAKPESHVSAIVVGADRVAANGDTANKIGTYALAVLAKHHGVKFLVAAPRTTIDRATPSGKEIVIEERAPSEVTTVKGPLQGRPAHVVFASLGINGGLLLRYVSKEVLSGRSESAMLVAPRATGQHETEPQGTGPHETGVLATGRHRRHGEQLSKGGRCGSR